MTCFSKCHKFPVIKGTFESSFTNLDHKAWKICPLPPNSTYPNMGIQHKGSAKLLHLTWLWQMDVNCLVWQITSVWRHCSEAEACCQAVGFPLQGLSLLSPGPRALQTSLSMMLSQGASLVDPSAARVCCILQLGQCSHPKTWAVQHE